MGAGVGCIDALPPPQPVVAITAKRVRDAASAGSRLRFAINSRLKVNRANIAAIRLAGGSFEQGLIPALPGAVVDTVTAT